MDNLVCMQYRQVSKPHKEGSSLIRKSSIQNSNPTVATKKTLKIETVCWVWLVCIWWIVLSRYIWGKALKPQISHHSLATCQHVCDLGMVECIQQSLDKLCYSFWGLVGFVQWKNTKFSPLYFIATAGFCMRAVLSSHLPLECSPWHCLMACWPRGTCRLWRRRCNWWKARDRGWSVAASPYWPPPRTPFPQGLVVSNGGMRRKGRRIKSQRNKVKIRFSLSHLRDIKKRSRGETIYLLLPSFNGYCLFTGFAGS